MTAKPRIVTFITGLGVALMLASGVVHARNSYLNSFNDLYGTTGTRLDSCGTCHYDFGGGGSRNFYGEEFLNSGLDFAAIEPLDVDNDGVVSIDEINLLFMPGLNCDNIALTSGAPADLADYVDPNNPGCGAAQEPDINLNPDSLFGEVTVGTTQTKTTLIENLGTADLNVSMISLCPDTSMEYMWSPDAPFTVTPSGDLTLSVTYSPVDVGPDPGCLEIYSNDPDENPILLTLTGEGIPLPPLDLDIAGFRVTKRVSLSRVKPVAIKLVVKNGGMVEGSADATVVGMQNEMIVYSETISVTDPVGDGRTTYEFPAYTPEAIGDIMWTATIADVDPDVDEATAVTRVVP